MRTSGLRRGLFCLLAAAVALTQERLRPSCPPSCRCDDAQLLEVNCSHVRLTAVPENLHRDTKTLNLSHNKIQTLARHRFLTLTRLADLDLSDNLVWMVELEAFVGLKDLLTLRLARNQLQILPAGAFLGLSNLRFLDISSNRILVFLDFAFRDLATLRCINASDNDLVFISRQAFSGLVGLRELQLDGWNLTAVPTDALTPLVALRSLVFHHLGLSALPDYSFHHLLLLRELVISRCSGLETLHANSLFGLNLTSLSVTHCNLSSVPHVALHHLVYLVFLDLSFNPIASIRGNLLGGLLRLQELHLVGGSLLRVAVGAFGGLMNFRLLNVSGNLLSTLESGAFQSVDSLKSLGLDQNPLACDCRLLWLVRRRLTLNFGGRSPSCSTSPELEGWSFLDFSNAELPDLLTCRRPRILNRKPGAETTVDQGHTVVFHCHAEGDPPPSVRWTNPQLRPLSSIGRIRTLSNGSLEVRYAQPQDAGSFLCVASNAAGNDSVSVRLRVRAFPSSPKNAFSLKGRSVRPSASPSLSGNQRVPFDVKTLAMAAAIGFLSFFSSVSVCFLFMFLWSKSKGQLKHTATIAYVPRRAGSGNNRGTGNYTEASRFTMKLI